MPDREQYLGRTRKAVFARDFCKLLLGEEIRPFAKPKDGWSLRRWERQLCADQKAVREMNPPIPGPNLHDILTSNG